MNVTTKIKRTVEIEKVIIELSLTEAMSLKDILYKLSDCATFSGNLYYKLLQIEEDSN